MIPVIFNARFTSAVCRPNSQPGCTLKFIQPIMMCRWPKLNDAQFPTVLEDATVFDSTTTTTTSTTTTSTTTTTATITARRVLVHLAEAGAFTCG